MENTKIEALIEKFEFELVLKRASLVVPEDTDCPMFHMNMTEINCFEYFIEELKKAIK